MRSCPTIFAPGIGRGRGRTDRTAAAAGRRQSRGVDGRRAYRGRRIARSSFVATGSIQMKRGGPFTLHREPRFTTRSPGLMFRFQKSWMCTPPSRRCCRPELTVSLGFPAFGTKGEKVSVATEFMHDLQGWTDTRNVWPTNRSHRPPRSANVTSCSTRLARRGGRRACCASFRGCARRMRRSCCLPCSRRWGSTYLSPAPL